MGEKKKLTWLLILQGWTMLWVIIGHAPLNEPLTSNLLDISTHKIALSLYSFAYSFHMKLFIMISGYLFYKTRVVKGWSYLDMVKEKWIRLGIPYIVFITIALILKMTFAGSFNREAVGFLSNYIYPFNGALQEMWFVAVIFIYFLAYPIYQYLLNSKVFTCFVLLISGGLFYIPVEDMSSLFAINRAIHFFVFFLIGMIISHDNLEQSISSWKTIIVCVMGYVITYYFHEKLFTALFLSIGFWGLAIRIDTSVTSNLFRSFRNYTYQIFLIGIFVQIFAKLLYSKFYFPGSYPIWWLLCILLGIYVPVLLSNIPKLRDNRIFKRLFGL